MNPILGVVAWVYLAAGVAVAVYLWASDLAQKRLDGLRAAGGLAIGAGFWALLFVGLWPVWLVLIWLALKKEKASKTPAESLADEKNA